MTVRSGADPIKGPRRFTLAVDPGNRESAFALIDSETRFPNAFGKIANGDLVSLIREDGWPLPDMSVAVEMIASYGSTVGADVFETCVWIGRFQQVLIDSGADPALVKRLPVKMHHCHSAKATDATIRQALVDRFASGVRNYGKGTKGEPGWFYGFAADVWAAYALAVYIADLEDPDGQP